MFFLPATLLYHMLAAYDRRTFNNPIAFEMVTTNIRPQQTKKKFFSPTFEELYLVCLFVHPFLSLFAVVQVL